MGPLSRLVAIEGGVLLFGFFGIVAFKIASGKISLAGLLETKNAGPGSKQTFSPARLQLLIFTVVVAANYLQSVIANRYSGSLPGLPQSVVGALGGSQAVYLGGKALSAFIKPRT